MTFCQKHFDEMEQQVKDRGMGHLLAETGEEVQKLDARIQSNTDTLIDFDPLLLAVQVVTNAALQLFGPRMMVVDEVTKVTPCPICELKKMDWGEYASYMALAEAQRRGLMGTDDGAPKILRLN